MPRRKVASAVIVTGGVTPISPQMADDQFKLMAEIGPYAKQAWDRGEKVDFREAFFELWFTRWPEPERDDDDDEGFIEHRIKLTKARIETNLFFARATMVVPVDNWMDVLETMQSAADAGNIFKDAALGLLKADIKYLKEPKDVRSQLNLKNDSGAAANGKEKLIITGPRTERVIRQRKMINPRGLKRNFASVNLTDEFNDVRSPEAARPRPSPGPVTKKLDQKPFGFHIPPYVDLDDSDAEELPLYISRLPRV